MHLNYHFLKFLCPELARVLVGKKVLACFSQSKDELIFQTSDQNSERCIRAHLLPPQIYLSFPEQFPRAKRNSADLFVELIGDTIKSCRVLNFERGFILTFSSGKTLLFKLHGTRSNILLYQKGATNPSSLFRNELIEDRTIDWHTLERSIPLTRERFDELEGNALQFLPTLGTDLRAWLKEREYPSSTLDQKWFLMQELLDLIDTPLFTLTKKSGEITLSLLPEQENVGSFSNPIQAVNELFYLAIVKGNFEKEKNLLLKKYQDQLKKHESYISKTSQKLTELRNSAPPSQLADVIMAYLHEFEPGILEKNLVDFYTGKEIKILLKPNQKPQDLAENLYRKSKNRQLEWVQMEKTILQKKQQAEEISKKILELEKSEDFRKLKTFKKANSEDKVLQKEATSLPFKVFEFEGYPIWVGKSASSNDEMLRNFTKKDDLWLHARMVPGSHVLIKLGANEFPPIPVLERAAGLAAYYSKNKTESLAPVIYTRAKYVRKVKGAAAGSVHVEREQVLMIPPMGPDESLSPTP
jgi:predicted ribosome quality control (RQC) complex YloA/Tae2 family protein